MVTKEIKSRMQHAKVASSFKCSHLILLKNSQYEASAAATYNQNTWLLLSEILLSAQKNK